MHALEARQLLSSSYTAASSVTSVYLTANSGNLYDVDVRLNSLSATPTATLSPSSTDNSITIIGQSSGFKLIDKVVAAVKPTGGVKFHLVSASNGIMEVDAGDDDTYIKIDTSTSTGTTIVTETGSTQASDTSGTGVTNLVIRANDVIASDYHRFDGNGTQIDIKKLYPTNHLTVNTGLGTYDDINLNNTGDDNVIDNVTVKTGAGHDVVALYNDSDNDSATVATVDFGAGTNSGNGLGLENQLYIFNGCTATLAQFPGSDSHTIFVDKVFAFTKCQTRQEYRPAEP